MGLIRNRRVVPDHWRPELASTESVATSSLAPGDIIVSLERWLCDRDALLAHDGRVGVRLRADEGLEGLLLHELHALDLVEFHFSSFAEGRAYSQARLLRARHGFRGGIRASGDVSRDRLSFMQRCGFDEFLLDGIADLTQVLSAFDEFSLRYQPDGPNDGTVAHHRGFRRAVGATNPG